jgi:hypothetical protein
MQLTPTVFAGSDQVTSTAPQREREESIMSTTRRRTRSTRDISRPAAVARPWPRERLDVRPPERPHALLADRRLLLLVLAVAAGLPAAILPLTPAFSPQATVAAVVASAIAASAAVAVVHLAERVTRADARLPTRGLLLYTVALCSAAAGAIHLAVAKMHFEEYALFGVFFAASGIAQLVWPVWLLVWRWRPLLALAAAGNTLIVALWAVDRVWGLPIGPEQWTPEPVGFGDAATSGFEVVLVVGCLAALRRDRIRLLRPATAVALTLTAGAVTTMALLSVLGVGASFLTPTE